MSIQTASQQKQPAEAQSAVAMESPPLNSGDHLSRIEFERRYQAHPEIKKAELIEGVVYMPSPTRFQQHSSPHFDIIGWLGIYCAATPGVKGGDNATVRLDFENEVQPDILMRLEPEFGGQTRISEDDYLEGPPELIIEIAASSASYDLHDKKRVYARTGVLEYVVIQMFEKHIDWFVLREGVYESLENDEDGVFCSEIFPGLWLKGDAFWSGELEVMRATLQEGLASLEHQSFVEQLQKKETKSNE